MTTTPEKTAPAGPATPAAPTAADLVTLTIDGVPVSVPKGTLIIRAAEQAGIEIPRFCDHPGLDPVGACRQCLVEVWMPGPPGPDGTPGEPKQMQGPPGRMKPQPSCTMAVAPGMVVLTQYTSEGADKAQKGVMELLLINHPLDCPVCDKGGECPLQNQAMSNGRAGLAVRGRQAHVPQADQHLLPGAPRPRALRPLRPMHPLLGADRR